MTNSNGRVKKARMEQVKEMDILRAVRDYLRATGWYVWRLHQGLGSFPGLPDLEAIKDGCVVFIEVKRPGGKQSPDQVRHGERLRAEGGRYFVIHSVDEVQDMCRELFDTGKIAEHQGVLI